MSQIDIPFIAIDNKGLEVKNITKSYDNKRILDNPKHSTTSNCSPDNPPS